MNLLITGSNGFIGRHVCDYFKENGSFVIGLGRNPKTLANTDKYYRCDMSSPDIERVFEEERIDAIVHLAADMRKEPYTAEVITHNCVGTERILKLCTQYGVETFTELSSLPVIGIPVEHPITESHPLRPYSVYHITKIMEEMLAEYATNRFGLRTSSFRITAPVGIGMNPNTIFSVFVENAVNNKPIILLGRGGRKQTYIHVRDIAKALYLAITDKRAQGVYNLSSYNTLSNKELAERIIEVTCSKSVITYSGTEDIEENKVWDVSLSKIKNDIGFEPDVTIDEAIIEMADFFRKVDYHTEGN